MVSLNRSLSSVVWQRKRSLPPLSPQSSRPALMRAFFCFFLLGQQRSLIPKSPCLSSINHQGSDISSKGKSMSMPFTRDTHVSLFHSALLDYCRMALTTRRDGIPVLLRRSSSRREQHCALSGLYRQHHQARRRYELSTRPALRSTKLSRSWNSKEVGESSWTEDYRGTACRSSVMKRLSHLSAYRSVHRSLHVI